MISQRIQIGDYKLFDEEREIINQILESNRITEGKYTLQFEKKFAETIGAKYCTIVNSGTSALIVGLLALLYDPRYPKIKKNAKVITTPLTYIATSNAIKLVGLEPVYIDVNLDTFDINTDLIEQHLQDNDPQEYCMILPVHLMGYPCNMGKLNRIADKYDLVVFEDSAQAHGTKYQGTNTGTHSLLADYSFYIAHNIQCGEMGAIVTDDEILYKMNRQIKANGRSCDCQMCTRSQGYCQKGSLDYDPRFMHQYIGANFKTMEFQPALGLLQLDRFDEIIKLRQDNVNYLNNGLGMMDKFKEYFFLPKWSRDISFMGYPLVIRDGKINRRKLQLLLNTFGIESRPLFYSIPTKQMAYAEYADQYKGKIPNSDYLSEYGFYIGCHQYMLREDLNYIIEIFDMIMNNNLGEITND